MTSAIIPNHPTFPTTIVVSVSRVQPQGCTLRIGPQMTLNMAMPFYNYLNTGVAVWGAAFGTQMNPICIELDDPWLYRFLLRYVPSKKDLESLGFPVGIPTSATIYRKVYNSLETQMNENERLCARCKKTIIVSEDLKYTREEKCFQHWNCSCAIQSREVQMFCCHGVFASRGCAYGDSHVWSGLTAGRNGPFIDYAVAPSVIYSFLSTRQRIFGLDCEMCYTVSGMEVVRVGLVDVQGTVVYDSLVYPENPVLDYNTRYSGISVEDFLTKKAKTFEDVRKDLFKFIKEDTILIGHALENDLRVLKLIHYFVVDTSILYPHHEPSHRRSLKSIAKEILNVEIQEWSDRTGHDSVEDANICLRLVLDKLRTEFNINVLATK